MLLFQFDGNALRMSIHNCHTVAVRAGLEVGENELLAILQRA